MFKEMNEKQFLLYKDIFMRMELLIAQCLRITVCMFHVLHVHYQLALKNANLVTVNLLHMVFSIKHDIIIVKHIMPL